ncbi:MaoC family dehydratase [Pseudomonas gingeri]|uniref:MaoC family dehydratase n=1 Tax=Pseudomonas gingeri TaxID=117681 RepID=A0A7Y7X9W4_9PSED|nr:MaoC family dehydratase [Pseudomonas gingeri]NWB95755.1 MaoC family dehydratase [Pseudomonas gingeri]
MPSDLSIRKLYLDDISPGDTFRSNEYHLDETQIRTFAQQFDPQPFHLDADAAAETFFQGLAASGWHTAAITMKLLVDSVPFVGGIIGAGSELSWPRPTRPDDILHVVSTVLEVKSSRSKPDRGVVTLESRTLNQKGEECQRSIGKLIVFRKSG